MSCCVHKIKSRHSDFRSFYLYKYQSLTSVFVFIRSIQRCGSCFEGAAAGVPAHRKERLSAEREGAAFADFWPAGRWLAAVFACIGQAGAE